MLYPHMPPYLSSAVICMQGTAVAFFAVDLGRTMTVVATDKALALLRGEAALAHRAAMFGVQLVKQARQEVKPAAEVRGPTLICSLFCAVLSQFSSCVEQLPPLGRICASQPDSQAGCLLVRQHSQCIVPARARDAGCTCCSFPVLCTLLVCSAPAGSDSLLHCCPDRLALPAADCGGSWLADIWGSWRSGAQHPQDCLQDHRGGLPAQADIQAQLFCEASSHS